MANKHELMAARIESVFGAHHIQARVWEARVTPRFVNFKVTSAIINSASKVKNLPEDMALHLGVKNVRITRDGGVWVIQVPRETSRLVTLPEVVGLIPHVAPYTGVLGLDEDGVPLLIRLDSPDVAHIALAGTTGSGKSELLRQLLLSLAMYNRPAFLQFALIDPKGDKFGPLAALPHLWRQCAIASAPADAALLLQAGAAELDNRLREKRKSPRIIFAIDELADLIQQMKDAVTEPLQRLVQLGREQGLHVIAATQKPSATLVGGLIKANFPVRIVGSVVSADDAKVAAGVGDTGAERLLGHGDFLLIAKGEKVRFQGPYNDPWEYNALVALVAAGQEDRKRRAWSQIALEQGIKAALKPVARPLRPVPIAVADLVLAHQAVRPPVQRGGALVPYLPTHTISLPVANTSVSGPAVHHPAPPVPLGANGAGHDAPQPAPLAAADDGALPAFWRRANSASTDAPPAPSGEQANKTQKGALPRRPDGPNAADAVAIKAAHSTLGSLNKTCEWAYGSKGPLTMFWIKTALAMPDASAGDELVPTEGETA